MTRELVWMLVVGLIATGGCGAWLFHREVARIGRQIAPSPGSFERIVASSSRSHGHSGSRGAEAVPTPPLASSWTAVHGQDASNPLSPGQGDDALLATLTGAAGLNEWFNPDPEVLAAFSRYRNEDLENGWELWNSIAGQNGERALDLGDANVLRGLRGHLGEQVAADHLSQTGSTVSMPDSGSNPGWDLDVDGAALNVKVTSNGARTAADHFETNPDIPIVMNADAGDIPASAVYWDGEGPLQLADLAAGSVVVDSSLTASGLVDQIADSVPAVDPLATLGDWGDVIPNAGAIIAAGLSAKREHALVREGHTTTSRAAKNVAVDGGARAVGFWAGAKAGFLTGAMVDAGTGGATLGLGAVAGGVLGGIGGAKVGRKVAEHVKQGPLRDAADALSATATGYRDAMERESGAINEALACQQERGRMLLLAQNLLSRRVLGARARAATEAVRASQRLDAPALLSSASRDLRECARRADPAVFGRSSLPGPLRQKAALRAVAGWERRCAALAHGDEWPPKAIATFWDHLCTSPAGRRAMTEYVARVAATREAEQHACQVAAHEQFLAVVARQARVAAFLRHQREVHTKAAVVRLAPKVASLEGARTAYEREVRAAGGSTLAT